MTDNEMTLTRRGIVGAMAAAGAAAIVNPTSTAQAQAAPKTFVMVHGGWRGGWCWRPVADRLEKLGHKVYTPTLTGLADKSHLLAKGIGNAIHTADVVNLIKWERLENIVLVGHSLGGMIITPVAQEVGSKISSIVYLDAFLPAVGDAALSTASQVSRDAIAAAIERGELGTKPLPAKLFGDSEKNWAWIDELSTMHPLLTLTDKCTAVDGREKIAKKTYIRAHGYPNPAFNAALEKTKADKTWKTYELQSGHDVMIEMPERLVEILLEVA